MEWKKSEPSLNLIQILPSENEKSEVRDPSTGLHPLRLQVGSEAPPVGPGVLATIVTTFRGGWLRTSQSCHAGYVEVKKAVLWIGRSFGVLIEKIVLGVKQMSLAGLSIGCSACHGLVQRTQQLILKFGGIWGNIKPIRFSQDPHIPATPEKIPAQREQELIQYPTKLERDELLWEVHALRDQLGSQQEELALVTTQMGELKALALSQQQVLLHLGQELETIESKFIAPEKPLPKKAKSRTVKTAKPKPLPSTPHRSADVSMTFRPDRP